MKKLFVLLVMAVIMLSSCADSKTLLINGKETVVKPYGWADSQDVKVPGVVYKVNVGNIIWSVILSETIVIPVWLTGWQLMEPVKVKVESPVESK